MDELAKRRFFEKLKKLAIQRTKELTLRIEIIKMNQGEFMTEKGKALIDITEATLKLNKLLTEGL